MTSQRRLTKEESDLRSKANKRETQQMYIDLLVKERSRIDRAVDQLRLYHAWLIGWLNKINKDPDTDPHPIASPWTPSMQQLAEFETLLLDTPRITSVQAQYLQLPITGDIDLKVTQGQPSKQTTSHQQEFSKQEIILSGQAEIRQFFHSHSEQMPKLLRMSLKNSIKITDLLEQGKFFPETYEQVQVHFDLLLDDTQFICE